MSDRLNESGSSAPTAGLKLVLKRRSGGKYEVKSFESNVLRVDENNNNLCETLVSARPKRAAAQKVKFIFSDEENNDLDEEGNIKKSKRAKNLTNSESKKSTISAKKFSSNLEDSDVDENRENQPISAKPAVNKSKASEKSRKNLNPPPRKVFRLPDCREILEPISKSDTVKIAYIDIIAIVRRQPTVAVIHSPPFPIALVDNKTKTTRAAAVLYIHLFQTYKSPCIHCTICRDYLAVIDFHDHVHNSENEDDEDDDEDGEDDKSKNTILPYTTGELNENELRVWRLFIRRYGELKAEHLEKKRVEVESKRLEEEETKRAREARNEAVKSRPIKKERKEAEVKKKPTREELDLSGEVALEIVLSNDGQVESTQKEAECTIDETRHFANDDLSDLSLSEDENSEIEINLIQTTKATIKTPLGENNANPVSVKTKPSLIEKYFNMYDNLSKDILIYICDNQFTIIPDTFIRYINSRKELKLKMLKLTRECQANKMRQSFCNDFEFERS